MELGGGSMREELEGMGFPQKVVMRALRISRGDFDAALQECLASIPKENAGNATSPPPPAPTVEAAAEAPPPAGVDAASPSSCKRRAEESASPPGTHQGAAKKPTVQKSQPSSAAGSGRRVFIRRIIDADNSCLFNSVGYCLGQGLKGGLYLRQIVSDEVLAHPAQYSEAVLGKPPSAYAAWIKAPQNWGGEIEMNILSQYLGKEIAAVDIQTLRSYIYGEGSGYTQRLYVIYDGIHFDALAENFESARATGRENEGTGTGTDRSSSTDVTLFDPKDASKLEAATSVARSLREKRQFTDVANFDLKCLVCGTGLVGQTGAQEHAKSTGHQNFGQI